MNEQQKQQAEHLYLNTEKTQQQITAQLGIDPKTLYRWIKQGHWQQLKTATRIMPSILVENIYAQLDDINYGISQRDRGQRHPTKDESLTINRLMNCIGKVKKQTSHGQNIEFLMNFIDYVQPLDDTLAKTLTEYGSGFLKGSEVKGFHPYDVEYANPPSEKNQDDASINQAVLSNENPINTSLSFGEGRGEASPTQNHNPNQLHIPFPGEEFPITSSHNTSPLLRTGRGISHTGPQPQPAPDHLPRTV